jgi:adenylate cyclase
MNPRLERRLRLFAIIVVVSVVGSVGFSLAQGHTSLAGIAVGVSYGLLLTVPVAGISLFVLPGPLRLWLGGLSFTADLMVRSAIFAAIILPTLSFQLGHIMAGVRVDPVHKGL